MKIRPLIGRRIRIGRRLHANQPQHCMVPSDETSNSSGLASSYFISNNLQQIQVSICTDDAHYSNTAWFTLTKRRIAVV